MWGEKPPTNKNYFPAHIKEGALTTAIPQQNFTEWVMDKETGSPVMDWGMYKNFLLPLNWATGNWKIIQTKLTFLHCMLSIHIHCTSHYVFAVKCLFEKTIPYLSFQFCNSEKNPVHKSARHLYWTNMMPHALGMIWRTVLCIKFVPWINGEICSSYT